MASREEPCHDWVIERWVYFSTNVLICQGFWVIFLPQMFFHLGEVSRSDGGGRVEAVGGVVGAFCGVPDLSGSNKKNL
jgi:hypothetical protein